MRRIHAIAAVLLCTTLVSAAWLRSSPSQDAEELPEITSTEEWNESMEDTETGYDEATEFPGVQVDMPDSLPMLDTPFFIYGDPENRHFKGAQIASDVDKVGVHQSVVAALPGHIDTLKAIANKPDERLAYLSEQNIEFTPGKVWFTEIGHVATVNGVARVHVFSMYNGRTVSPGHGASDGHVVEYWAIPDAGPPAMLFRASSATLPPLPDLEDPDL